MNLISNCVFSLLIAGAAGLAVAGVLQAQGSCTFLEEAYSGTDIDPEITHYLPFPGVCAFSDVPKALPIMLGLLVSSRPSYQIQLKLIHGLIGIL